MNLKNIFYEKGPNLDIYNRAMADAWDRHTTASDASEPMPTHTAMSTAADLTELQAPFSARWPQRSVPRVRSSGLRHCTINRYDLALCTPNDNHSELTCVEHRLQPLQGVKRRSSYQVFWVNILAGYFLALFLEHKIRWSLVPVKKKSIKAIWYTKRPIFQLNLQRSPLLTK